MKKPFKKLAVGTMFAAAVGYVAGILTAPKSGKETREELRSTWAEGEKQLKHLHTELNTLLNQAQDKKSEFKGNAKKQYDEAVDNAKKAKEKARELLSAIHEGETEDKDLKKAIDEANKAAGYLKTYLKKK